MVIAVTQKPLMVLAASNLRDLHARPLTGMNFHVIQSASGFLAAFQDGAALPLYAHKRFYCVDDLLAGDPVPTRRIPAKPIAIQKNFPSRFSAVAALLAAAISPRFPGAVGALPLIATYTLAVDTVFRRYVASLPDRRFVGG